MTRLAFCSLSPSSHDIMGDIVASSVLNLSKAQIMTFFSENAPLTQQKCDHEAEQILCTPVHPASVQGGTSYTVVSNDGTYVVQFRSGRSALDIDFLKYVEQAYDGFTPHHEFICFFGELYVYKMDNVGGVSMYLARTELHRGNASLLRQTVSDFARYVDVDIPHAPSSPKEITQLTPSLQVFCLSVAQDASPVAMSRS